MKGKIVILLLALAGSAVALASDAKTWTGTVSDAWDTTTLNWLLGSEATTFAPYDDVTFADTAERTSVKITDAGASGGFNAGKVVFDSSSDYTLTGSCASQDGYYTRGLCAVPVFEKRGTGTLTVNGMHSFTGDVEICAGTYKVGSGVTDINNARNSQLGDPRVKRTIRVQKGATLEIVRTGLFGAGTSTSDVLADVEVNGGTLKFAAGTCTCFGNLLLKDATLDHTTGANTWPLICMNGSYLDLQSTGTTAITFPNNGSNSGFFLSRTRPIDIRVPDITGDDNADVVVGFIFKDVTYSYATPGWMSEVGKWYCTTNFVKTGAGRLSLTRNASSMQRDIVVSNGVLSADVGLASVGSGTASGVLGNAYDKKRTIFVEKGAELRFTKSDIFGQFYNNPSVTIHIRGGTFKQTSKMTNSLGPLVLEDATLDYEGTHDAGWPSLNLCDVTFGGSTAITLPLGKTSSSEATISLSKHVLTSTLCTVEPAILRVPQIVSGGDLSKPDVTIATQIQDTTPNWNGMNPTGRLKSAFKKTGAGVLRLAHNWNGFQGDVILAEGKLTLAARGNKEEPSETALGNLQTGKRVTLMPGTEMYIAASDTFGQLASAHNATFCISNATLRFAAGTANGFPSLELYDPNFAYTTGNQNWGLMGFRYKVTFDGTKPIVWPGVSSGSWLHVGYSSDFSSEESETAGVTNLHGKTEFCVKDITGNAAVDVDIGLGVRSLRWWNDATSHKHDSYYCGILKTGPGTLRLAGTVRCTEEFRINEGTLQFDGTLYGQMTRDNQYGSNPKATMRVQSGAYLAGQATVDGVVLEEGGGFASCVDQTQPLKCGTVTIPSDKRVIINLVYTNDLNSVGRIVVPVVKATSGLEDATFAVQVNGATPPPSIAAQVYVSDGIVYGKTTKRRGAVILFR